MSAPTPPCCSAARPHAIPSGDTVRDLEPGVTHYLGGVQSTGPLPTPSSVTMWRPGRDGGQREIGTLLQVGERKALLEITDPAAVRALLNGITLRDIAVRP